MRWKKRKGYGRAVYSSLLFLAIVFFLASWLINKSDWAGLLLNLSTEFLGVVAIFFLLEEVFLWNPQEEVEEKIEAIKGQISQLETNLGSLEIVKGEKRIYPTFIKAIDIAGVKGIRSTALGGRQTINEGIKQWFEANNKWFETDQVNFHKKVVKISNRAELEANKELYAITRNHPGYIVYYIELENLAGLDVLILDNKEVWIAFPPIKGKDELSFAIRIKNEEITAAISNWYDNFLWDSGEPLTDEVIKRLDGKFPLTH
jgi:hypothetical protein